MASSLQIVMWRLIRAVGLVAVGWVLRGRIRHPAAAEAHFSVPEVEPAPRGRYDVRQGSKGYSQILGTVSGFGVAGVVLVLTLPPDSGQPVGLVAGLLVLSMAGCLLGAFGFAAISGETVLTRNLAPATLFVGISAGIGVTAVLVAFEVLAASAANEAAWLFKVFAGVGACLSVFLCAFASADSVTELESSDARQQPYLKSVEHAYRVTYALIAVGITVPLVALGLSWWLGPIPSDPHTRLWNVSVCVCLVVAGHVASTFRTSHVGVDRGLTRSEAWLGVLGVAGGSALLLLCMQ